MGLIHDFILLTRDEIDRGINYYDFSRQVNHERVVHLSDDIIGYIQDTLNWVTTFNPSINKYQFGLNYFGVSYIDKQGVGPFSNILKAWLLLFTQAPDLMKLTGNFTYSEDEDESKGHYEKLYLRKHELIVEFNRLIEFCDCIEKDNYAIIYLGI
ncbi:hypothetical protein GK047_29010 [Paenibacillus sp. SYP-B3998]|uniref:DUF1877 family protein n=1 Tax=Paenibacillus sp. SYP-B3998 TaxID=2678564 RepID=A0A6G4A5Z1_9BACL|nr:hypothetical protein [Paenibacillus sp. SYP-B3998]NEW09926.1 hypothetical protein [Paenibacillus sp. SYP-B3998]